jgi:hypothetical protein
MSELTSTIMDKFSDFVYSPKPGGVTDIFADTERVLIQSKINESINSSKTIEILDNAIEKSKKIQVEIQGMIGDIDKKETEGNKTENLFRNSFPYGEVEIEEGGSKKLDSIEKTNIDQMEKSSKEFARLCKTLLPTDYREEDTDILMDIFGSIADYPFIDRTSNGMMSIRNLHKLFDEFYMNYSTEMVDSRKTFNPDGPGIDKQKFFNRFLEVSSLQLEKREKFDDPNFRSDIGDIFEFNPDLWYADFTLKDAFINNRVDYLSDSYGAFFRAPGLSQMIHVNQISLGNPVNEFTEFGTYHFSDITLLSNEEKIFCLLFQERKDQTGNSEEILKNYSYPDYNQREISSYQNALKYLYNSNEIVNFQSGNRFNDNVKFKNFYLSHQRKYFNNEEIVNNLSTQNGGSKKKLKGGTTENLFDVSGIPNLLAKRSPKKFNPVIFKKSIERFQIEKSKYNKEKIDNILDKIKKSNKLPIFYHDLKTELGDTKISYEELRFLFHWSSVYTTYKKLLVHFLNNIVICYNYYSTIIVQSFIRNTKDAKNAIIFMPNKIEKLISHIQKMITKLKINLLETGVGKKVEIRNLFVGFNIVYKNTNGANSFPNIQQDKYFKDYSSMAILPNEFKTFMQIYCLERKIILGGIPVTLSKESFNKNIPYCFKFFLQYRFLANKNFIDLLEVFKIQNEQKLSKQEYESIEKSVKEDFDKMIEPLISQKNSIEKYRVIIFRSILFAIKEFIKTLNAIELNIKSQSQIKSTSRLSRTNTNTKKSNKSNSKNFLKIGEFKQKIYNFIYKLKKLQLDHNLYLFLYGQLFQFIYRIDQLLSYNEIMTPEDFRQKFNSLGIDLEMSDRDMQEKAAQITQVLTDSDKSFKLKKRFFGLFSPKEVLQNNAKRLISTSFDPEALKPYWWVNKEKEFLKLSGGRRLFVIAIEPVINLGKFSKLNVWLIDVFGSAQSQMKPLTRNYIKTIEEVGSNGFVKREYYGDNQMVMLNPYFRTIREFKGDLQKWVTKDPVWWKNPEGWKKKISDLFTNKSKKMQQGEYGRLFADWLGIRQLKKNNKNNSYENFKNSAVLTRLIQGKLDSYIETNNRSNKLKFSLLMGYDDSQLRRIYIRHLTAMEKGQRFASNAKSYDDWQLYLIENKDYSSSESFRMWAFNLLMSKPWVFNKESMTGRIAIPISNFSRMQVPFKNFFVKVGDFGISSVLLDFFKLMTEEAIKNTKNIKEKKIFIPQVDLSELELPQDRKGINIAEGINRSFKNKVEENENRTQGQSTVVSSVFSLSNSVPSSSTTNPRHPIPVVSKTLLSSPPSYPPPQSSPAFIPQQYLYLFQNSIIGQTFLKSLQAIGVEGLEISPYVDQNFKGIQITLPGSDLIFIILQNSNIYSSTTIFYGFFNNETQEFKPENNNLNNFKAVFNNNLTIYFNQQGIFTRNSINNNYKLNKKSQNKYGWDLYSS